MSPVHMLLAYTSSVYGANENMPYKEIHKADNQMSFTVSKKSTETIAHSYSHLFDFQLQCLGSLRFIGLGVDQTWRCLSLLRQFWMESP